MKLFNKKISTKLGLSIIIIIMVVIVGALFLYSDLGWQREKVVKEKTVSVYFSNFELSEDCGDVFPVKRRVFRKTPEIALKELFWGPTQEEKTEDYTSWFSEETKAILNSVKIDKENIAWVDIKDIRLVIPGANSSCGSSQFISSIEATLEQFGAEKTIISFGGDIELFYEWMQIGCIPENDYCGEGESSSVNFSKEGNLVINNPGFEKNRWYLLYDEPGSAGASVKLFFDDSSSCAKMSCEKILTQDLIGSRVKVKGNREKREVLVREIIFLENKD